MTTGENGVPLLDSIEIIVITTASNYGHSNVTQCYEGSIYALFVGILH